MWVVHMNRNFSERPTNCSDSTQEVYDVTAHEF